MVVLGRVGARGAQDDNQIVRGGFVAENFPEKPRWLFAYGREQQVPGPLSARIGMTRAKGLAG